MLPLMHRGRTSLAFAVALAVGGCGFDDKLVGGVRITCDDDADCVGGTACAADRLCRDPDVNAPPVVEIGAIERTVGDIKIPVTVFDVESDPAVVDLEVKNGDGGWRPIAVDDNRVATGPAGEDTELVWHPQPEVLAADVFNERVLLRATPRSVGSEQRGETVESPTFAYGNTAPEVRALVVPEVVSGSAVPVVLRAYDAEGDTMHFTGATLTFLSRDGLPVETSAAIDAKSAFELPGDGSIGADVPTKIEIPGTAFDDEVIGFVWDSTQRPSNVSGRRARLTITIADSFLVPAKQVPPSEPFVLANGTP